MVLKNLELRGKNNCSHYFIASRYSSYVLQTVPFPFGSIYTMRSYKKNGESKK